MASKGYPTSSNQASGKRAAGEGKHMPGSENTSPNVTPGASSQHSQQGFKPWVQNPADVTLYNPRHQKQKFDRSLKYSNQWEPGMLPEDDKGH